MDRGSASKAARLARGAALPNAGMTGRREDESRQQERAGVCGSCSRSGGGVANAGKACSSRFARCDAQPQQLPNGGTTPYVHLLAPRRAVARGRKEDRVRKRWRREQKMLRPGRVCVSICKVCSGRIGFR